MREGIDGLTDDAFTVKIAKAVHEVIATYTIDDQKIELTIRLTEGFPLQYVQVKDSNKTIEDRIWRSWILGIQQMAQVRCPLRGQYIWI